MKQMKLYLLTLCLVTAAALWTDATAQTVRYVKAVGAGAADGSSWADASGDLQAMINASATSDEIWVAAGTYKPIYTADGYDANTSIYPTADGGRDNAFVLKAGVRLLGGFPDAGTPALTDRDWKTFPSILSGDIGTAGVNTDNWIPFSVSPSETRSSAYNDGTITATSYDDVANEQWTINNEQLRAWTQNGTLYVKGLTVGKPWYIYNLYGQLIYTGIADGDVETQCIASLQGRGFYIILSGNRTVKVAY